MTVPDKPILLVEARFYDEIADMLAEGALAELTRAGVGHDRISVPGALEIPAAIGMAAESALYAGFVALGCVIRGETSHYDIVAGDSARGLMHLGMTHGLAIGNGILTVETRAQAVVRADPEQKNKGGAAAAACLAMIDLQRKFAQGKGT